MRIAAGSGPRAEPPPLRAGRPRPFESARRPSPVYGPRLVPPSAPAATVRYHEPTPEAALAPGRASTLQVLAACGVPFATFDARGACGGLSDAAAALIRGDGAGEATLRWAGSLAAAAGRAGAHSDLPWTGRSPNGRWWLRAQLLPPGDPPRAVVVVFLPATPEPDDAAAGDPGWGLTPRESAVARLLAAGKPSKAIAAALGISTHTARRHTERVFAKLGVRSRTEAMLALSAWAGG